jgi:hypothetical protein
MTNPSDIAVGRSFAAAARLDIEAYNAFINEHGLFASMVASAEALTEDMKIHLGEPIEDVLPCGEELQSVQAHMKSGGQ